MNNEFFGAKVSRNISYIGHEELENSIGTERHRKASQGIERNRKAWKGKEERAKEPKSVQRNRKECKRTDRLQKTLQNNKAHRKAPKDVANRSLFSCTR